MFFEKTEGELKETLRNIGINEGDILYVSSDIKTFLYNLAMQYKVRSKEKRDEALDGLIRIFQETVTEKGTLLFPVFSWAWCHGQGFDYKMTKGEVGSLSNWVLENRSDFIRTRHPIYSFMVWGKDAEYLKAMDNQDAWSHSSPFYYLHVNDKAKQLLFNIEAYDGLTFGHYIEQEVAVPYRHPKYFFGEYTDERGIKETRMYSMYVRDMGFEAGCAIRNSWLIEKGVAKQSEWNGSTLTAVELMKSYQVILDDMLNNNGENTLTFADGKLDLNKSRTIPYEVKGIEV